MHRPIRLGLLTPSSNTSLEPLTSQMVSLLPAVTCHFSRFKVTHIGTTNDALSQFGPDKMLPAAQLLADAHVNVIGWSGTSASWMGFERDTILCEQICRATGIPATTSILALNEILKLCGFHSFGLATPYAKEVQEGIIKNYQKAGFHIPAESHLGISDNFAFSQITQETLTEQVASLASQQVPVIVFACTNLISGGLVHHWERDYGIPILDSTLTVVWKMLRLARVKQSIKGWGKMMSGELVRV